jgi:hypothetical protein
MSNRKINFKVYKKALIEVAEYYKGQTLNKDEMVEFWDLVERAYRHHIGCQYLLRTRAFHHNTRGVPILKKRNMLTVKRLSSAFNYVIYSFSGGTHE